MRFLERNLWVSLALLVGAAIVLLAAAGQLGGTLPSLRPIARAGESARPWIAPNRATAWFATNAAAGLLPASNRINPFFTLQFQPAPPPPTKRVELLYQGRITSSAGESRAYVRLGDTLLILTNGAKVVADHVIVEIGLRRLVITNAVGTNILEFNVRKPLEVPAN